MYVRLLFHQHLVAVDNVHALLQGVEALTSRIIYNRFLCVAKDGFNTRYFAVASKEERPRRAGLVRSNGQVALVLRASLDVVALHPIEAEYVVVL